MCNQIGLSLLLLLVEVIALGRSAKFNLGLDVDLEALYRESVWSIDAWSEDVTIHGSSFDANVTLSDFHMESNFTGYEALSNAFLLSENVSIDLGACSECAMPSYTFATWVNLNLSSNRDEKCAPVDGPVAMIFLEMNSRHGAMMKAQVSQYQLLTKDVPRAREVADLFMWNHFAIVVNNGNMSVYCNGFLCVGNESEDKLVNVTATNLILNKRIPDLGCKQVAYEKVTLWERVLNETEIRGLRFAPFNVTIPTTTPPSLTTEKPSSGHDGDGDGGGNEEKEDTTPVLQKTTVPPIATTEEEVSNDTIVLPPGPSEDQLDYLIDKFNSSGPVRPELIEAGVEAALSAILNINADLGGKDDDDTSYESEAFIPPEEEQIISVIGVSEELFSQMTAAGLKIPPSTDSGKARYDMLNFMNELIALDNKQFGSKEVTHIDGVSMLTSLENVMQSFLNQKETPFGTATDNYEYIHVYEKSRMDVYQTTAFVTFTKDGNPNNANVYMEIPPAAYEDYKDVKLVIGAVYDVVQRSMPKKISRAKTPGGKKNSETVEVISPIISLLVNFNGSSLKENITFLFKHRETLDGEETICSFLSLGAETTWETHGCIGVDVNTTFTLCYCSHLTNFALLMATDGLVLNSWHNAAATYLTYATLSISVVCLIASLVILLLYRRVLKSKRIRILRHTALSMLLAHLLFLFGDFALAHETVCTVVAALLHYLFMSVFCWMFVMGFQLYTKVRRASKTHVDFLYYVIFGWGFPLGIVGISVGTDTEGYGTVGACWLDPETNTIWAFVGPAMGILLFNALVMILVMRAFVNVKTNKDKEALDRIRTAAKAVIIMLPILGLTWLFGLVVQFSVAFVYLFILLNGLQGLFLFLFHVAFNDEVKAAVLGKRNKVKSSSGLTAAFAGTTSTETGATDINPADNKK